MHRRLVPVFLLSLCLVLLPAPAFAADLDPGLQPVVVTRITSDGHLKDGAVISGDGSTVAWFQTGEGYSDLLMVAPSDGSAAPRTLLATDPKTDDVNGLYGPKYTPGDNFYHVRLRTQHIHISGDGSLLLLEGIEYFNGGALYGWITVNTASGSLKYIAEAYPQGMGVRSANTYGGATSVGEGYYALSGDGSTILFVAKGTAENASQEILVALDIPSGNARRLAGYSALSAKVVNEADPKGGYSGPWVSHTGQKVGFSTYYNWTTDLYTLDFGQQSAVPKRVESLRIGSTPRFTAAGEYLVARHPYATTSTFWPTAGGEPKEIQHRDVFTFPFYDGQIGLVEVPLWSNQEQEVRVVRPDGAAVMLKPGEKGLPSGWSFGVPGLSNSYHWTLADAFGRRVLLPLISTDGKSQDLFVLTLQYTASGPHGGPDGDNSGAEAPAETATVTVTWDPVSPAPTGYKIYRSTEGPGVYDPAWPLTDFPIQSTTYTDSGLAPDTYYYTILPVYRQPTGEVLGQPIYRTAAAKAQVKIVLKINSTVVQVGDKTMTLDVAPFIQNGRTLVPLRFIGEQLGASIAWDQGEQRVTYTKADTVIQLWIGRPAAEVNGQPVPLDVPPHVVSGRTMVPLRFVAQALGATTDWNGETSEVTITAQ